MLTEEQYQRTVKAVVLIDENPDELIEALNKLRGPEVLTVPDDAMILYDSRKVFDGWAEQMRLQPGLIVPVDGIPRDVIQFVKVQQAEIQQLQNMPPNLNGAAEEFLAEVDDNSTSGINPEDWDDH